MIRPFVGVLDLGDGGGRVRALSSLSASIPGYEVDVTDADPVVVAAPGGVEAHSGVLCVVDGVVYNGPALAADLGLDEAAPSEVVLAAGYRRWGSALASRLRGEFLTLIWDCAAGQGVLFADQVGSRRVFLREEGRRLWFGSEVRNVLAALASRPGPDPMAISHWLAERSAPEGRTLYEGISGLPWGHLIEISRDGWAHRRYWRPEYQEPLRLTHAEMIEQVRGSLLQAVERRVTPGAPTGILTSGGLDSTSVAALAHRVAEDGALACSATFPDYPQVDESAWLDRLEAEIGLETLRRAAAGPGLIASGLEFMRRWELPLHVWSEAWVQPVLQGARERGAKAILGGEGGDELFGTRFYLIADLIREGRLPSAAQIARGLPEVQGRAPRKAFAKILWRFGAQGLPPAWAEALWQRLAPGASPDPWWASERCIRLLREAKAPSWRSASGPRWWAYSSYTLTEGPHAFGLFDHLRRRGEQAGLEARHPLYDLDLLELMMRMPPEASSVGRLNRPVFREAMTGISPDAVRLRPDKSMFDEVMRAALNGPEMPALRMILGHASEVSAYLAPGALAELLKGPSGQRESIAFWTSRVLRLAGVEVWLQTQEDSLLPERLLEDSRVVQA